MHKVQVRNDIIHHKWLRKNARDWWSVKFGTEKDTYTFKDERDLNMFKQHVDDLDQRYEQFIAPKM